MGNVLLDLDLAEARRQELEARAAHERLVQEAVRQHKAEHPERVIDRLLRALKRRRTHEKTDPRLN